MDDILSHEILVPDPQNFKASPHRGRVGGNTICRKVERFLPTRLIRYCRPNVLDRGRKVCVQKLLEPRPRCTSTTHVQLVITLKISFQGL